MDKVQMIYLIIETVIFCIPLATLVWKFGKQSQRIEEHGKRIQTLEGKEETSRKDIEKQVSEIKIDIAEIKTSLEFIKDKIK